MGTDVYTGLTISRFNAIVEKALCFLRNKLTVSKSTRSWYEEDGVIYFSVTTDGTTGEGWINGLEGDSFFVGDYAKQLLRSSSFVPTSGATIEVAVLKGMLFKDSDRTTKNIRAEAACRNWEKPDAELACLIRKKFTDKEIKAMGLWYLFTMHEPINDLDGDPRLLVVHRDAHGRHLQAFRGRPGRGWHRKHGFAFAMSPTFAQATADKQVGSQS